MKRSGFIYRSKSLKRGGFKRAKPKYVKDATGDAAAKLKRNRAKVWKRDNRECQVCGGTWALQVHHIVPRSRGVGWAGLHDMANLVLVCGRCHEAIHSHRLEDNDRWLRSRPTG